MLGASWLQLGLLQWPGRVSVQALTSRLSFSLNTFKGVI